MVSILGNAAGMWGCLGNTVPHGVPPPFNYLLSKKFINLGGKMLETQIRGWISFRYHDSEITYLFPRFLADKTIQQQIKGNMTNVRCSYTTLSDVRFMKALFGINVSLFLDRSLDERDRNRDINHFAFIWVKRGQFTLRLVRERAFKFQISHFPRTLGLLIAYQEIRRL